MLSDPLWPYIIGGFALFLLGGILAVAIRPFGVILAEVGNGFLRVTRIKLDAGRETVSEDEVLALMDIGEEEGTIEADEKEMIENIFAFNDTVAQDVMIHRTEMVMVWTGDTEEEIIQSIQKSGLSRFPVYEEDADDIVGILNTREYLLNARLAQPKPLKELVRDAYFVPSSVSADVLFRDMQSKKVHLAIVVDEYGGTSGLLTMEDLIEEIVGNIYDEFDPQEVLDIVKLDDNLWRMDGSAELDDVAKALGITFAEDEESDTLGGLVFDQLSVIPEDGSQAEVETSGLRIQVKNFVDRRVDWALVSKLEESEQDEE